MATHPNVAGRRETRNEVESSPVPQSLDGHVLTVGGGHAGIKLAQEIRNPGERAHGAVAHHPMAVDGGIDQGHEPEVPGHFDIAIEREGMEIDKLSGELQGDERAPRALPAGHAAGDEPIQQQQAIIQEITPAADHGARRKLLVLGQQRRKPSPLRTV